MGFGDALCINQSDSHKKTDQVKAVVKIYENASRTLVWLGRASSYSSNAIDIIKWLDRYQYYGWNIRLAREVYSQIRW
jgi:hypothetical protein